MLTQNFIKLSAAVHELLCEQRKKTPTKTMLSVTTADSNKTSETVETVAVDSVCCLSRAEGKLQPQSCRESGFYCICMHCFSCTATKQNKLLYECL